ncbi:MAG TPA: replication-associated recombination protein A [Aggregatilineales bacterium]|nr:replication-associated recombination protein A [Anaerolineales bacterium]HRE46201.1 replication-associated recombination protein A [Aggregatilineales bacterium]
MPPKSPANRGKPPVYDDDLFSHAEDTPKRPRVPLADRMRPKTFAEYVGQGHIIGEGRLLRRAIEADQLTSIILWGAPGTGKTTIANIIAHETKATYVTLNAVLDGIKELRDVVEAAGRRPRNQRTLLFIDEIHRWNKAQQDSLLPHIEAGTITLVGATTENPFYSLVNPLISRSRVFKLEPLSSADLQAVLARAIRDPEKGFGGLRLEVQPDALAHWVDVAHGDARSALNALELAVLTTPPDAEGVIHIDQAIAAESIQRRVVRYDRDQDEHYDTISAFIKSLRGSDPDAALYWLAKMLHAGEDPRFLFRRMLILCSEDIGLADPNAIVVVNSLAEAFERVGMPEGNYFLAHACLYCATAPKSNTTGAIFKALAHMEQVGSAPVPSHLRDSTSSAAQARHAGQTSPAAAYKSPHDYEGAWVAQRYLPEGMAAPEWYVPKTEGYEAQLAERLKKRGG